MDLTGPCDWPTTGCVQCDPDGLACLDPAVREDVVAWAVNDLWEATGRVYGTCPVSVYPCNDATCYCGNPMRNCGCVSVSEILIPGPVASVTSVVIDGTTLSSSAYRVDDYQWLVRLDGGVWPTNVDPTDPTGFVVTYDQGQTPPAGAGLVTGILACERAKALCGDSSCRLPTGTQQLTRQGVTMIRGRQSNPPAGRYFPDTMSIFGLDEVDEWVRNAQAPLLAGAVHSPDLPHVRRTTWEAP